MEPFTALGAKAGLRLADQARAAIQARRKLKVLVHRGFVEPGSGSEAVAGTTVSLSAESPAVTGAAGAELTCPELYFVKIVNVSPQREVEVTHVWFESEPRIDVLDSSRPLPARLRLDQGMEVWVPVANLPPLETEAVAQMARVRLSSGKVVKGRLGKSVPPRGFVAGPGSRP